MYVDERAGQHDHHRWSGQTDHPVETPVLTARQGPFHLHPLKRRSVQYPFMRMLVEQIPLQGFKSAGFTLFSVFIVF